MFTPHPNTRLPRRRKRKSPEAMTKRKKNPTMDPTMAPTSTLCEAVLVEEFASVEAVDGGSNDVDVVLLSPIPSSYEPKKVLRSSPITHFGGVDEHK